MSKEPARVRELEAELARAREEQAAFGDVLRAINDPAFDLQALFRRVAEHATRLCHGAYGALVYVREGAAFRFADGWSVDPTARTDEVREYQRQHPPDVSDPAASGMVARVVRARAPVIIADLMSDPEYPKEQLRLFADPHLCLLGVPLMSEGEVVGTLNIAKVKAAPFTEQEIDLARTFADQVVIAIQSARRLRETKDALERQTALAAVLRSIAGSPTEVRPVLDVIAENAIRFTGAHDVAIRLASGDKLELASHAGPMRTTNEIGEVPLDRSSAAGTAVLEQRTIHIPDVLGAEGDPYPEAQKRARLAGNRALLVVPLTREGSAIGVIIVRKTEPTPFDEKQIQLVETFADQAVIAIENVRLFNETKDALDQQTAVSKVLESISSSAFELDRVLRTIADSAGRLTAADTVVIDIVEGDELVMAVRAGPQIAPFHVEGNHFAIDDNTLAGRAIRTLHTQHQSDVRNDPRLPQTGPRTRLLVPIVRDGLAIGVLGVTHMDVRPFTPREIALVETFAKQAGIAMENVRLFNETKDALEQQTAVSEVLKTISRTVFELDPTLQTVVENAARLCDADVAWMSEWAGTGYTGVVRYGRTPELDRLIEGARQSHKGFVSVAERHRIGGLVYLERRTINVADIASDPDLAGSWTALDVGARSVLAVPVMSEGEPLAAIMLARVTVRPFSEREAQLVETFADQAAIAIKNVRLVNETKEALERQTAVSEVLKTISRTVFDLGPALQTVLENAGRLVDGDVAWMTQRIDDGTYLWAAKWADTPDLDRRAFGERMVNAAPIRPVDLTQGSFMSRIYASARTINETDVLALPEVLEQSPTVKLTGARSLVGVPVRTEGTVLGAFIVARMDVRPFTDREVQLVETFADQAAIAIQNVRLFNEIQEKSGALEIANRHKSEFLANMSHELRTPLNAIIGFSEVLLQGIFGEVNEKQREYLDDVLSSGKHLLSLINDILDLSKIEAGRMELELSTFSLADALESGMTIVQERATRHGITLSTIVPDDLPSIEADERKVKQILYNLLSNAVKFTPDGGRIEVRAGVEDGIVRIDVTDTGIGIAPEDQGKVFEEFQQVGRERSREGTGLGLTLTKRFVELHGGRIWVESVPGTGSTFTFTLPLDRRAVTASSVEEITPAPPP